MKVDYYINLFQHKTNLELVDIMEESDKTGARQAVIILLNRREENEEQILGPSPGFELIHRTGRKSVNLKASLNPLPFFKSYGLKDFLSVSSLCMTILALSQLNVYYASEDQIHPVLRPISISLYLVLLLLNHIFHKIDHKKTNTFIGRGINDLIFLIMLAMLSSLHELFTKDRISVIDGLDLQIVVSLIIMILIFESVISLIKYLFQRLNWQLF